MLALKFFPLVFKQVYRQRTRSLLTVAGVSTAMVLFCTIQSLQSGMRQATEENASDTTLVVYRENRFCPSTSRLPERYADVIAKVQGVKEVVPIKIVVSNCRAGLDVVTFRGVPAEKFAPSFRVISGSIDAWRSRTDAALVGEALANRRRIKLGDKFEAAGISVSAAAIISSDEPQDQNVAYVHLGFLQRAASVKQPGVVTQFNVKVEDSAKLQEVAERIDQQFKTDQDPTETRSEKAFIARAAGDLLELISFTRWLGIACVLAVLALVANTVVLSVQDRVREHAVLQTLGYKGGLIARLILVEGLVLSLVGGLVGATIAQVLLSFGGLSLSNEGVSVNFDASPTIFVQGLAISVLLGVVAGLVPAWQASRREIVSSFRAV